MCMALIMAGCETAALPTECEYQEREIARLREWRAEDYIKMKLPKLHIALFPECRVHELSVKRYSNTGTWIVSGCPDNKSVAYKCEDPVKTNFPGCWPNPLNWGGDKP